MFYDMCFQKLSEKEQEAILGGYSSPKFNIFFQLTNILTSSKNQLNAVNGDTSISTSQETTYQFSQLTMIITSSLENPKAEFSNISQLIPE